MVETQDVYFISTVSCTERREKLLAHIKKVSKMCNPIFFPAVEGKPGWIHCGLSHISLIECAKSIDLPYIIVFEDDTELVSDFDNRFESVLNWLKSSNSWDVFNGNPSNMPLEQHIKLININPYIVSYQQGFTTNFTVYSSRSYDSIISLKSHYETLLTVYEAGHLILNSQVNKNAYDLKLVSLNLRLVTAFPYLSKQATGYSVLEDKVQNYDSCIFAWGQNVIYHRIFPDLPKLVVKLLDSNFDHQPFSTLNQTSNCLAWNRCKKEDLATVDDHDIIFFTDHHLDDVLSIHNKNTTCVAWLLEPPVIHPHIYQKIESLEDRFDYILTFDKHLIDKHKSNVNSKYLWYPVGGTWITKTESQLYERSSESKLVSIVASSKTLSTGHKFRHEIVQKIKGVDAYGRAYKEIDSKLDSLKDYCFQIVVENCQLDDYFTEKIGDCFATGCVPVYWGTKHVNNLFDKDGIICFDTIEELEQIMPTLTFAKYKSMIESVKRNFELIEKYRTIEDWLTGNCPAIFSKTDNKFKSELRTLYEDVWNAYSWQQFRKVVFLADSYLKHTTVNDKRSQYVKFFKAFSLHKLNLINDSAVLYKDVLQLTNLDNDVKIWCSSNLEILTR